MSDKKDGPFSPIDWEDLVVKDEFDRVNPAHYAHYQSDPDVFKQQAEVDRETQVLLDELRADFARNETKMIGDEASRILREHRVGSLPPPENINETARENVHLVQEQKRQDVLAQQAEKSAAIELEFERNRDIVREAREARDEKGEGVKDDLQSQANQMQPGEEQQPDPTNQTLEQGQGNDSTDPFDDLDFAAGYDAHTDGRPEPLAEDVEEWEVQAEDQVGEAEESQALTQTTGQKQGPF